MTNTLMPHPAKVILTVLFLLGALIFSAAAEDDYTVIKRPAEKGRGVAMVLCGGDNDTPAVENNLYRQPYGNTNILSLLDRADFVESVVRDYTNQTAMKKAEAAQAFVNEAAAENDTVIVAAYSHGGQTIYYMDFELVDHLIMIDGLMTIQGTRASEPTSLARLWLKRFFGIAFQGTDILVCVSEDPDTTGGSENGYALRDDLNKFAADPVHMTGDDGETVEKISDGWYALRDKDGRRLAYLRLIFLEGAHGWACLNAARDVGQLIDSYRSLQNGEIFYYQ